MDWNLTCIGRSRPQDGYSGRFFEIVKYVPIPEKDSSVFLAVKPKHTPLDYVGSVYFVISLSFLLVSAVGL
jgi:hypothetical protein